MGKRPSVWLKELVGADVDVMLVCGEREARPIRQGTSEKTMSNLLATGRLEFEYIPGLDHGLLVEAHRERIRQRVTEHVAAHFSQGEN
jgi:alpha-beta hydrolase superfamily lysophospholipase